ncbi:hypothetical protein PCIT_a0555 [Pseudoalteromonas citrea]|uniref:Uncharacterized protein n=2 Tax=Pseudoalteromonas citrea TaxID=43655 RepID=A0AAD4AKZ5_9GAMM|nr:hypothetical protein [Pseudoalteromonas citrea]KAF7774156.1 hypothetical protein PCIT_a0555 [Pseudoalteromonas citrea]
MLDKIQQIGNLIDKVSEVLNNSPEPKEITNIVDTCQLIERTLRSVFESPDVTLNQDEVDRLNEIYTRYSNLISCVETEQKLTYNKLVKHVGNKKKLDVYRNL